MMGLWAVFWIFGKPGAALAFCMSRKTKSSSLLRLTNQPPQPHQKNNNQKKDIKSASPSSPKAPSLIYDKIHNKQFPSTNHGQNHMDVDLEVAVEVTVNPVKLHQAAKNVRPHFHTLNDAEKKTFVTDAEPRIR